MIVVSDTSPLNYLVIINAIEILPKLFKDIHVPPEVMNELQRLQTPDPVKQWAKTPPPWLHITTPTTSLSPTTRLDPGESQAIALAKELHAQLILIDERKGRSVAKQEGLAVVGTITVLEMAAQQKLLELKPALQALQRTTFRISASYIDDALKRDAARKIAESSSHGP